jgi:FMN phosphatase YigB (HAD superfamily)
VPPARRAFFDDVEANVAGARRAGLQAHQVTGPDQIARFQKPCLSYKSRTSLPPARFVNRQRPYFPERQD